MIARLIESCVTNLNLTHGEPTNWRLACPSQTLDLMSLSLGDHYKETKRRCWGLIFTCSSSRPIHIKVLETMDASYFICTLCRFFSIRGAVAKIRYDQGTKFIGGKSQLEDALLVMDQRLIQKFTAERGCEWVFNPPHASHFEGVWETPNQYGPTRVGCNANEDRMFPANARTIGDAHGRSYWNRQQPPLCNNTF